MLEAARVTRMPCGGNCTRDRRRTPQEFRHSVAGLPAGEDADARERRIAVAGGLTLNSGTNGHFAFLRTATARGSGAVRTVAQNRIESRPLSREGVGLRQHLGMGSVDNRLAVDQHPIVRARRSAEPYIYGYLNRVRSSRRLEAETHQYRGDLAAAPSEAGRQDDR
jgi:hypothetical protein